MLLAIAIRGLSYSVAMSVSAGNIDKRLGSAAVLEEADIRLLLATFSRRGSCAIRDRALVLLLWRTGLRITEALSLEVRDLTLDGATPTLKVRNGKFGKQRVVGIHQEAVQSLERWLEVRVDLGLSRFRPIFCTLSRNNRGHQLSAGHVREMLSHRAKKAGISGRVHPHAFRATLAVELAREGVPLPAIRDVLGHSNVAATDAYLRRVFPQDAVDAVVTRHAVLPAAAPPDPAKQRKELVEALANLDDDTVARLLAALKT